MLIGQQRQQQIDYAAIIQNLNNSVENYKQQLYHANEKIKKVNNKV